MGNFVQPAFQIVLLTCPTILPSFFPILPIFLTSVIPSYFSFLPLFLLSLALFLILSAAFFYFSSFLLFLPSFLLSSFFPTLHAWVALPVPITCHQVFVIVLQIQTKVLPFCPKSIYYREIFCNPSISLSFTIHTYSSVVSFIYGILCKCLQPAIKYLLWYSKRGQFPKTFPLDCLFLICTNILPPSLTHGSLCKCLNPPVKFLFYSKDRRKFFHSVSNVMELQSNSVRSVIRFFATHTLGSSV